MNVVEHEAETSPGNTGNQVAQRVVSGGLKSDLVGKELGSESCVSKVVLDDVR